MGKHAAVDLEDDSVDGVEAGPVAIQTQQQMRPRMRLHRIASPPHVCGQDSQGESDRRRRQGHTRESKCEKQVFSILKLVNREMISGRQK